MITKSTELLVPIRAVVMRARVLLFSLIIAFTSGYLRRRYTETIDVTGGESLNNSVLEMGLRTRSQVSIYGQENW
jgi:hypothetical protein